MSRKNTALYLLRNVMYLFAREGGPRGFRDSILGRCSLGFLGAE